PAHAHLSLHDALPIFPPTPAEEAGTEGAARLYAYLRQSGGLAMSHTSATLMGTDWRDNDAQLEPLVEIYQGDRTSAEYEGAPRRSEEHTSELQSRVDL